MRVAKCFPHLAHLKLKNYIIYSKKLWYKTGCRLYKHFEFGTFPLKSTLETMFSYNKLLFIIVYENKSNLNLRIFMQNYF